MGNVGQGTQKTVPGKTVRILCFQEGFSDMAAVVVKQLNAS